MHVVDRGNGQQCVFHDDDDFANFVGLMEKACWRTPMRVIGCCLMPNHFHLVLWPKEDGDLSKWMQWLMTSHVRRYHRRYESSGHVWQGRFRSFPVQRRQPTAQERTQGVVQTHNPLLDVVRYVERNPLRAGLVQRADKWPWSSLHWWAGLSPAPSFWRPELWERPANWLDIVARPQTDEEIALLQQSLERSAPFGSDSWRTQIAADLGLGSSLRPRGRPRKR